MTTTGNKMDIDLKRRAGLSLNQGMWWRREIRAAKRRGVRNVGARQVGRRLK